MQNQDFSLTFIVDQAPNEVFNAVNNVRGWWSMALDGSSEHLNDEFIYRHKEFHYSRHKLVDVVQDTKVVWLVTDSNLTFVQKQDEWNDTRIVFDISEHNGQTKLLITHVGLVPQLQCFEGCSKGWTYYLQNSLLPLITKGKGNPDQCN